jgi:hypothetical protein
MIKHYDVAAFIYSQFEKQRSLADVPDAFFPAGPFTMNAPLSKKSGSVSRTPLLLVVQYASGETDLMDLTSNERGMPASGGANPSA